jgi:hypothetical protein
MSFMCWQSHYIIPAAAQKDSKYAMRIKYMRILHVIGLCTSVKWSLMLSSLLKTTCFIILLAGCSAASHSNKMIADSAEVNTANSAASDIAAGLQPESLMNLPQTQDGGFVLASGFYEAEFKTYCLQPGTPGPSQGDAYLQGNISGNRKDIVESVLLRSREQPDIAQRNIQLLLWSVVSGSDFNKLSPSVQSDARRLLTPKQVFKLKGGVVGAIRTISYNTGLLNANSDIKRLFETGVSSYEAYERLAVLTEPSQVRQKNIQPDQWYKQPENYYVRYFPISYQKVKIQVYVPDGLINNEGKLNGEYLVFDPTGKQAIPAFSNAQRLGIGNTVLETVRKIIEINKPRNDTRRPPVKPKEPVLAPKLPAQ